MRRKEFAPQESQTPNAPVRARKVTGAGGMGRDAEPARRFGALRIGERNPGG